MSANLVVDLGATCDWGHSLNVGSGSDFTVGRIVDLSQADTYCQIYCTGGPGSGVIELRVQTSDSTSSGSFTDPTSGLAGFPTWLVSGGIAFFNSGLHVSGAGQLSAPVNNAPLFCSGGAQFGAFQRPHKYARILLNSGVFPHQIHAGVLSNKRTVGSGGGFTFSPLGGVVNV